MCGYDPLEEYEKELDRKYKAFEAGYDSYEEYDLAMQDYIGNLMFDGIHDDR